MAAGIGSNAVAVWDAATLRVKAVFPEAHDVLAFSAHDSELVVRGTNYFRRTLDIATHAALETISPGSVAQEREYAVLSPDGRTVAAGSSAGVLTFFDAKTGKVKAIHPKAYEGYIFPFNFSPNAKLLATSGQQAEADWGDPVKIWDGLTGKQLPWEPGSNTEGVLTVAFSPDSRTLATGSINNSIHFYNTTTWLEIPPSRALKEFVRALAFSPDGKTFASASADGTLKFWSASTHRLLTSLKLPTEDVPIYLVFSPDNQTLAAWGYDHALHVWRAPILDKN